MLYTSGETHTELFAVQILSLDMDTMLKTSPDLYTMPREGLVTQTYAFAYSAIARLPTHSLYGDQINLASIAKDKDEDVYYEHLEL